MVGETAELPLVVTDKVQEYDKTKQAVIFLKRLKIWNDIAKVLVDITFFVHSCSKRDDLNIRYYEFIDEIKLALSDILNNFLQSEQKCVQKSINVEIFTSSGVQESA